MVIYRFMRPPANVIYKKISSLLLSFPLTKTMSVGLFVFFFSGIAPKQTECRVNTFVGRDNHAELREISGVFFRRDVTSEPETFSISGPGPSGNDQ